MTKRQSDRFDRWYPTFIGVFMGSFLFLGLVILPCVEFYNLVIQQKESILAGLGQIQNQYQRRADLIPNIVEVVKGYAKHERETLIQVTEARAKATQTKLDIPNLNANELAEFARNQEKFSNLVSRLLVIVEAYPELKADKNFMDLQNQLVATEDLITEERTKYHDATRAYNARIDGFPGFVFARLAGWKRFPYFAADPSTYKAPKINIQ